MAEAIYRTVRCVTGDGRHILAYERIVPRVVPPVVERPVYAGIGRPRKDDPTTERRRATYRRSTERANHRAGKCTASLGVPCEIA